MTKTELIAEISRRSELTKKDSELALNSLISAITDTLAKGDSVVIPGFISISVKKRAAREGRNPSTGAALKIAACNVVSFKTGTKLKEAINKK